ncbi:MAG: YtxH domain-containing protein [Ignavibacteria bacterium]|nr:YtxH domain-containing protein [Ignavibacteria bacterium]
MTILVGALAAVVGGAAGWFISRNISRFTGGVCPILCNPRVAVPYFAFMGLMIGLELFR